MALNDQERLLLAIDLLEPRIRRRFIEIMEYLRDQVIVERLATLIEQGRTVEALADAERVAAVFAGELRSAYVTAAKSVAQHVQAARSVKVVVFDETNFRAVARMRENTLDAVRQVTDSQRDLMREVLASGVERGMNPRAIARDFRDSIGLTSGQHQIVENYRRQLQQGDRAALSRELRDRRYDRSVEAALRGERKLTTQQVDTMVERYRQRWITYRSEAVARTEALKVVHQGADDLWRQLVDNGDLDPGKLIHRWVTAKDERVRSSHRPMNGQERDFGEAFRSGNGIKLMYPGDPSAPAKEIVHCRCTRVTVYRG